jgi:hypothetical protein
VLILFRTISLLINSGGTHGICCLKLTPSYLNSCDISEHFLFAPSSAKFSPTVSRFPQIIFISYYSYIE